MRKTNESGRCMQLWRQFFRDAKLIGLIPRPHIALAMKSFYAAMAESRKMERQRIAAIG